MTNSNSQNLPDGLEQQLALLAALADKPLVLPPVFVDITGSHTAGLLLQQGVYWTKKNLSKDPANDGWFFISLPKLQEQLRMGEHCLRDARSTLKERGFMASERRGCPPQLFFRVDLLKVLQAVNFQLRQNGRFGSALSQKSQNAGNILPKPPNDGDETSNPIPPKRQNPIKEQETKKQETKQETTEERCAPAGNRRLPQSERDSWDLRRWQAEMKNSEPQPGTYIPDRDAYWRQRAKEAAFCAGLSPVRIVELLKQHFPNDPNVDLIYQQPELFAEQSA